MGAGTAEEPELPVREGQVLDGKFRVERLIGEGAMGLVVEATHLGLDERVALKFLRREARTQPEVVARFAREARAAVKLKSDYVARVFDVGGTEDGTPFIVMEFLEGSDLATILEMGHSLEIPAVLEYIIQACEGLTEAHAKGIVHRDIKPENLFLAQGAGARKQIKLLDFGISKASIGTEVLETDIAGTGTTTQIMGSPQYMSPDQIRSTRDVDGRADIWSLGVVLFELITGRTPFPATDITQLISQILHEPHQRLTALRPDAPVELEAIVDRCLAKDAADRYQNAADLAIALLPYAPKRTRAIVERAADIARAAGSSSPITDFDSLPPPPAPSSQRESVESLVSTGTNVNVVATISSNAATPPNRPGIAVWVIAALVLLLGIGAGVAAIFGSGKTGPTGGTAAAAGASNGTGWASVPSDTAGMDPASTPTTGMTAASTGAGSAHTGPMANTTRTPIRGAVPSPTSTAPVKAAPPKSTESEIRMER